VLKGYLELEEGKEQEVGEDCIMKSFIIYTLYQIVGGQSN